MYIKVFKCLYYIISIIVIKLPAGPMEKKHSYTNRYQVGFRKCIVSLMLINNLY